jgi:large subunit ribosomal protein L1
MLEKLKRSKFDETVELHINTIETGVSGNTTLPHGTGKQIRVAIADDDLLAKVAAGKIDFDVLLANPTMMPKLARVAKILGPRGLMPNPKNATLVKDPEKAIEAFKKGQMNFKTEAKAPIMHLTVGKMSFGSKKLSENIETLIDAIKKEKIRNVTLKSTMSPGIKIQLN